VNLLHHWICRSAYWKRTIETELLPWALDGLDLGDDVLEIGPGYGLATNLLRSRLTRLTCVEVDGGLAHSLSQRMARTNVTVVHADAAHLPLPDATFSAALCFDASSRTVLTAPGLRVFCARAACSPALKVSTGPCYA
jgi:16S rRNA A1518/A1519 N6-dimethyltransferase RsmA/KsgA/DIM1 with predicted DNA glycosylase/AP lyase activity